MSGMSEVYPATRFGPEYLKSLLHGRTRVISDQAFGDKCGFVTSHCAPTLTSAQLRFNGHFYTLRRHSILATRPSIERHDLISLQD